MITTSVIAIAAVIWWRSFRLHDPCQCNFFQKLFTAVAPSLVGGLFGSRENSKSRDFAAAQNATRIQTTVADAEAAGINPLTAIQAGGAAGFQQPSFGNLASFDAITGAIKGIQDVVEENREEKQAEKAKKVEDAARAIERKDAGGVGNIINRTARLTQAAQSGVNLRVADPLPLTNRLPKLSLNVATNQGVVPLDDVSGPTPTQEDGTIDLNVDDGGTGTTLRQRQRIVTRNGETIDVTEGPEIDTVITGVVADIITAFRERGEKRQLARMRRDDFLRRLGNKRLVWDDRFGGSKPQRWDQWNNLTKFEYIQRNNK